MTHLLSDGGYQFMIPLLILLITILILIVRGIKNNTEKSLKLIKSVSLFALVFGFLGFTLGLISALDKISQAKDIAPQVLAGGFKLGILPPTFGMFIFLVGRAGIILLIGLNKENQTS
jgi:hypothetical protein